MHAQSLTVSASDVVRGTPLLCYESDQGLQEESKDWSSTATQTRGPPLTVAAAACVAPVMASPEALPSIAN